MTATTRISRTRREIANLPVHKFAEWRAFRAGFDRSGEGFNGEYVHPAFDTPDLLDAELFSGFKQWQATRGKS